MDIIFAQISPRIGDIPYNTKKIIDIIASHDAPERVIVFPEMCVMGYPMRDMLWHTDLLSASIQAIHHICTHIKHAHVIVGAPYVSEHIYNAAYVLSPQGIERIIKKKFLPNREVFYEARYFAAGDINDMDDIIIDIAGQRVGVFICEDLLGIDYHGQTEKYNHNIDYGICISASPYRRGHIEARHQFLQKAQKILKCPLYITNQIGAYDDIIFDGSSFWLDEHGHIYSAPSFEEGVFRAVDCTPYTPDNHAIQKAIKLGISAYCAGIDVTDVTLGLSGGIDSAVVAGLCADVLGADHVHAILMPSRYSSPHSIDDAVELAKRLGINYEIISIDPMHQAYIESVPHISPLTLEDQNIQSRIRGAILMAKSSKIGGLVINTSNKSELLVGYSTLYGDSCGAIAPIADLWKTQVYDIARQDPRIPSNIINKPPSAELAPDQYDADTLPDYDTLDAIGESMVRRIPMPVSIDSQSVSRIQSMSLKNEFKRRQFCTIIKLSYQSFGSDWMQPIIARPSITS